MSTHAEVRSRLSPFMDGELSGNEAAEIRSHLAGCAECREAEVRLATLRREVRGALPNPAVPAGLADRVRATIRSDGAPARRVPPRWVHVWAIAASIAVVVAAGLGYQAGRARSAIEDQLIEAHVRSLIAGHLFDVASTDQHTVKPWFDGRIDFAPPVTDLATQGFPLLGGRLDFVEGRPAAALVYGRRRHVINLFVWPGKIELPVSATVRGYHIVSWEGDGMTLAAVSDVGTGDLETFATAVREAAK